MRKIYVRNYLVFVALLILFACWLLFASLKHVQQVRDANYRLADTTKIILTDYRLVRDLEKVLSLQRNFLVSGNKNYINQLSLEERQLDKTFTDLKNQLLHNKSHYDIVEAVKLQTEKIQSLVAAQALQEDLSKNMALGNLQKLHRVAATLYGLNEDLLRREHLSLQERTSELLKANSNFNNVFLIGGSVFLLIMLFFNSYILKSQFERIEATEELEAAQQRLNLAFEGMNEGVFDWDISKGEVFYSDRFIEMLGYEKEEFEPTFQQFEKLIHPDDLGAVKGVIEAYLDKEINEYSAVFRMKHKKGHWVWINSRAKTLFDKKDNPIRMTGSHRDITGAREIEQHLIDATRKAEKANEAKSRFLAHMSHEIRTPLTAVTGIAEILDQQSKESDPTKQKLIKTLLSSSESLKDLINDVLDISKIEADEIKIIKAQFPLDDMFSNIKNMMEIKAQEKNLKFNFDFTDFEGKIFYGDRMRMRQILVNLIGNAIKFTDKGSVKIIPSLKGKDETNADLIIEVKDTGIGISKKDQKTVFSKFKQADSSASRKYGGTGLGLHISCELVRMMDGDIDLKSTKGKGSSFILSIPHKLSEMHSMEKGKEKTSVKEPNNVKGRKALLVEDYEANVMVVGHLLDSLDIQYDHAENGLVAISKFKKKKYDFVLMDIQMPEMDGLRATIEIRKYEEKKDRDETPIIAMTAHALTSEREKCFQIGMNEFVTKPLDTKELKTKITAVLKSHKKAA